MSKIRKRENHDFFEWADEPLLKSVLGSGNLVSGKNVERAMHPARGFS